MMNLRSVRPALTGLALLATASFVGCAGSDEVPVLPRLDVASVIKGGSADDAGSVDLAHEQLVNQQINVGHEVAATAEPKKPVRTSLRDRLLPGRKTSETLADFSTDPFLDDLDKMLVAGGEAAPGKAVGATEDAFTNTVDAAKRDAVAMFGPEPGSAAENAAPKTRRADPSADIDLVASQAAGKPAANELETTDFGNDLPAAKSKFAQFLQHSAKPFNKTAPAAAAPKDPFDPLNATDRVSLEPDRSEFEPFNDGPGETTTVQSHSPSSIDSEFEPRAATRASAVAPKIVAEPVAPAFPGTAEPADAAFKAPPPAEVTVPNQDSATVTANAPAALPTPSKTVDAEVPIFTESEPASPQKRVQLDPSLYEPAPVIDVDPFEDGSEFAVDPAPQFRTANRQVTVEIVDQDTTTPVAPVSQTMTESTAPSSAVQPTPAPARALIPPGEWTAWFLIAGAITVALLLFAPGRGRS